ncbi:3-methyl-2-oxobutanoate hydroxymethyltransferase [Pleionea mediterranea]|uniref:3-methyl-2-oxobutanoate hydroxymethyltransferase n=1 Tax=Pleionea mediterranea TaxID=523701 RepID=A0A316FT44_9GAMM|nr:3-methyl-2-oxobutanoate hydroxymethyltransferase [Pleionea mediterranea]PWK51874.1 ketopantoate hydroxymethyltransferase [Pleionea mediterranea]
MKKITLHTLQTLKQQQQPFAVLTAYDATFAALIEKAGIDVILVGDSLGNVIQGQESTVPVTMDDICYHLQCVKRGSQKTLVIADMPYMSYATEEQTYHNAALLMQSGANMVKLEGGDWLKQTIKGLSERGIPVCAHLGLTPQSVDALGGFKVQGRTDAAAEKLINDAKALEQAGASLLVMECVPAALAKKVTQQLSIPTIGIGAGADCDAQVLVLHDMLGLNVDFKPKFVKNFLQETQGDVLEALSLYAEQVKQRKFPTAEHSFD